MNYKTHAVCGEPVWSGADGRAVCETHNLRAVDNERQCQANQTKYPWLLCPNKARGSGKFCMRQHSGSYVSPEKFRKKDLRSTTRDAEVTADEQQNVDVYLGNTLATNCWKDGRTYQLDHVVECQAVAAVFGKLIPIFPSDRAKRKCTTILFYATNDRANLRLTATWANAVKEVAESDFLDDWVLEEGGPKPFRHYVAAAVKNGQSFGRADVQRVCAEVKRGMRQFKEAVMRQFEDAVKEAGKKTKWAKELEELSIQVKKQLKALYKAHQFSKKPRRRHSTGSVTPLLSLGRGRSSASSTSMSSSKTRAKTSASARNEAQQAEASPRKTPRRRTASARGLRS